MSLTPAILEPAQLPPAAACIWENLQDFSEWNQICLEGLRAEGFGGGGGRETKMQFFCSPWIHVLPPFCSEGLENLASSCKLHQELTRVSKPSRCFLAWISLVFPLPLPSLPKAPLPSTQTPLPWMSFSRAGLGRAPPGVAGEVWGRMLRFCRLLPPGILPWMEGAGAEPGDVVPVGPAQHVEVSRFTGMSSWRLLLKLPGGEEAGARPWEGGLRAGIQLCWRCLAH